MSVYVGTLYYTVLFIDITFETRKPSLPRIFFLKWDASSRWSLSLYCPMRNSDEMTIAKTHPTLYNELTEFETSISLD